MRSILRRLRLSALVAVLSIGGALPAAGKLWIVSDSGCPGVDFSTIQEAVDAAADGDVILVRPPAVPGGPAHASFDVVGKSLCLVADPRGGVLIEGVSSVRNLGASQWALVQGFDRLESLDLRANAGPVWIEDTSLTAGALGSLDAVTVTDCALVLFARCTISGGSSRGASLMIERSRAQLYDTSATGGAGFGTLGGGLPGGVGLEVRSGVAVLTGCDIRGGRGGSAFPWRLSCFPGGPGGAGLLLTHAQDSKAYTLGTLVNGGQGGSPWSPCSGGSTGPSLSGPGQLVALPGLGRSFRIPSPILENEALTLTFGGQPGDVAQLFTSSAQQHIFMPAFGGTLGPALPGVSIVTGVVPPSGPLTVQATMPAGVVPPGEAAVLFSQGFFFEPTAAFLGATSAWVILDENHDLLDGCRTEIWVDDDAPGDPGPGNPLVSNPNENGSLAAPFDAIQEAIAVAAATGAVVIVRDGTYSGPGNERIVFEDQPITVRSENGPGACTIAVTSPLTPAFDYDATQGAPTLVEGFTVAGGDPGFYVLGDFLTVRHCVVTGCRIGLHFEAGSLGTVESCTIVDNTGTEGAGMRALGRVKARNCLFADNRASVSGGGIYVTPIPTQTELQGCTFAANAAPQGGALHVFQASGGVASLAVRGCLFWGNGPEEIALTGNLSSSLDLDYCNVQGGIEGIGIRSGTLNWGMGNLNANPLFVNPAAGDYHLGPLSPCIDRGDPSYQAQPGETDFDGEARVQGAAVDIGGDER